MITSWDETPAGRFHSATPRNRRPGGPSPDMEELRAEAAAEFGAAWYPDQPPLSSLGLQAYYRDQAEAIKCRAGWVEGDENIRERIRVMKLIEDSDARVDRQEQAERDMAAEAQRRAGLGWTG